MISSHSASVAHMAQNLSSPGAGQRRQRALTAAGGGEEALPARVYRTLQNQVATGDDCLANRGSRDPQRGVRARHGVLLAWTFLSVVSSVASTCSSRG
jgi:hypothetical protein